MKVALISTQTHPIALGLRYVSSYLKAQGHDVQMHFMCSKRDTAKGGFSDALVRDLAERLKDRDLIGMGLMTNTYHRACELTRRLREVGVSAPFIWGGTHPSLAPQECLDIADAVCIGEGEVAVAELVRRYEAGEDPTDIPGLGFPAGGVFGADQTVVNPVGNLVQDLDQLPFPDYDLSTHWVSKRDRLVPAREDNLRNAIERPRVLSTRGCPNRCTFCNNAAWRQLYRGKGRWVRMRSVDNVVAELESMKQRFPCMEAINIVDDLFFVRSAEQMAEFAKAFTQRVNLPLELDAYPGMLTAEKLDALEGVPIRLISLGIESASPDTLANIYDRRTSLETIVEGIELLHGRGIPAEYHYIVNNPFEPEANVIETMRFIADHHRGPARCRVFPLIFFPGTPLFERAKAEGVIEDRDEKAYKHTLTGKTVIGAHSYLDVWLRIVLGLRNAGYSPRFAHAAINVATHRVVRAALDRRWFGPVSFGLYQVGRRVYRNLIYQPIVRPLSYLRRLGRRRPSEDVGAVSLDSGGGA